MKTASQRPFEDLSEAEALFLEHALAYYRDMKTAAKNAPYGRFLDQAENVAVLQGRELLRQSPQAVAQEEIDDIEKKRNVALQNMPKEKRHHGYRNKNILTAAGKIVVTHRYDECLPCRLPEHAVDEPLGLEHRYTVGSASGFGARQRSAVDLGHDPAGVRQSAGMFGRVPCVGKREQGGKGAVRRGEPGV